MLRSELAGAVVADAGRPMWFGWRGRGMIASSPRLNKLPHSTLFTMRPPSSLSFFFFKFSPAEERGTRNEANSLLSFRIIFVTTIPFFLFILSFRDIDNPEGVKITGIHLFRINGD